MRFGAALAAGICALMTSCNGGATIGKAMKDLGYYEIRPPSEIMTPGTLVVVRNANPFAFGILCPAEASLGPDVKTLISRTRSQDLQQKLEKEFSVDPGFLKVLTASAKYKSVKDIKLRLANVHFYELPIDQVYANVGQRTNACWRALDDYQANKLAPVSMIQSSLIASVTYEVEFHSDLKLGVETKKELADSIAEKLVGLSRSKAEEGRVHGDSLIWGIFPNDDLVRVRPDSVLTAVGLGLTWEDAIVAAGGDPVSVEAIETEPVVEPFQPDRYIANQEPTEWQINIRGLEVQS